MLKCSIVMGRRRGYDTKRVTRMAFKVDEDSKVIGFTGEVWLNSSSSQLNICMR